MENFDMDSRMEKELRVHLLERSQELVKGFPGQNSLLLRGQVPPPERQSQSRIGTEFRQKLFAAWCGVHPKIFQQQGYRLVSGISSSSGTAELTVSNCFLGGNIATVRATFSPHKDEWTLNLHGAESKILPFPLSFLDTEWKDAALMRGKMLDQFVQLIDEVATYAESTGKLPPIEELE
jgi:hypothetical protein